MIFNKLKTYFFLTLVSLISSLILFEFFLSYKNEKLANFTFELLSN